MKRPIEKDYLQKYGMKGQPQYILNNIAYRKALNDYIDCLEFFIDKDELIKAIIHGHRYALAGTSLEKTIEKYEYNK